MIAIRTQNSIEQIIRRLEAIYRALAAAPDDDEDARVAEAVAGCLRRLHAIAAQGADRRLHLVEIDPRSLH
jgi:hypothetical protein